MNYTINGQEVTSPGVYEIMERFLFFSSFFVFVLFLFCFCFVSVLTSLPIKI